MTTPAQRRARAHGHPDRAKTERVRLIESASPAARSRRPEQTAEANQERAGDAAAHIHLVRSPIDVVFRGADDERITDGPNRPWPPAPAA